MFPVEFLDIMCRYGRQDFDNLIRSEVKLCIL